MNEEKKYVVTFEFSNEDVARMFLGYMSDGGGEWPLVSEEVTGDDYKIVEFDYHTLNDGKFGPRVLVHSELIDEE